MTTNNNYVYRVTGMHQVEDIITSGYVRSKDKVKGGHNNELFWTRGGGNYWRRRTNRRMDRVRADNIGMLATNMNSLVLQDKFIEFEENVVVQSAIEMNKIIKFVNIDDAIESINNGSIVIFGGGAGNPLFSTDTAAAIRAIETKCDIMVKLTNVDGVYTDDPRINSNARKYSTISYDEIIKLLQVNAHHIKLEQVI